jgi:hypothetical protein
MLTIQSISVHGWLVGRLWGGSGWKPVHADITRARRRRGFYDAVKDLTDDGDFERCRLVGEISITMTEWRRGRIHTVEQEIPLSRFPSISACLHPDQTWAPDGDHDDRDELTPEDHYRRGYDDAREWLEEKR